jgi:hypothetical protein
VTVLEGLNGMAVHRALRRAPERSTEYGLTLQ